MTKEQFIEEVSGHLQSLMGDRKLDVSWEVITKNNNIPKYGIVVKNFNRYVSPMIYMDGYYQDYLRKKVTIDDVSIQIADTLRRLKENPDRYQRFSMSWEECREKIIFRLVSADKNKFMLEGIPFFPFLDLAVTFAVMVNFTSKGLETLTVTNELMKRWNITKTELYRRAEANTPSLLPIKFQSMTRMILEYVGVDVCGPDGDSDCPLIIASNEAGVYGASVILYPDEIKKLADRMRENLYILPSSIHELVIIPEKQKMSIDDLSNMVSQINKDHVCPEEVLSDQAYFYDRASDKFIY